jgi:type I restriction enzyme S subunit
MQVSIAKLSDTRINERFDSQFFQSSLIDSYQKIISKKNSQLSDLALVTDGNHLKIAENFDLESGVRYLRGQDLGADMLLQDRNVVYIPELYFNKLTRSHIFKNDILITIVGANTGLVGLVYDPPNKLVANCKLGIVRIVDDSITPGFLYSFLTSSYGQAQILRNVRGGGQTGLVLPDMRKLRISRFSPEFEIYINDIVYKAHSKIKLAKATYSEAEKILLAELQMEDWHPKSNLSYIKNYSDTTKAERIDGEYFQPKYDEIIRAVRTYSNGSDTIFGQFGQNKTTFDNKDGKIYKYIEIGCINTSDGRMQPLLLHGSELPANAKIKLNNDNVIVSKVRPYRGAIGIVDANDYVGSSAFTVLREKGTVNKETLMVYLRLKPLLNFSLKFNTGTSYPTITDSDILNFPLPLVVNRIQGEIKDKISSMCRLNNQANALLRIAKQGVEVAIEKDGTKATSWLNEQLALLNVE